VKFKRFGWFYNVTLATGLALVFLLGGSIAVAGDGSDCCTVGPMGPTCTCITGVNVCESLACQNYTDELTGQTYWYRRIADHYIQGTSGCPMFPSIAYLYSAPNCNGNYYYGQGTSNKRNCGAPFP
jgi:hypothetical protein